MHLSPVAVVSVLALWVLAVEAITDIVSNHLIHIPPVMAGALHAIMLLSGVVPGLYFLVFRPSARYIIQRQELESELTEAGELLEAQVLKRTAELVAANRALETKMDELQSAEQALRDSEERYRTLFVLAENAQDVIYRYDLPPAKGLSYISPAVSRVSGYRPDDYYADAGLFHKIFGSKDLGLAAGNGGSGSCERTQTIPLVHKNGTTVWVDVREVIIYEREGAVAIEGIARDVTERKYLEERLLRAQRLETAGLVAGQVAHDLNNLVGPMLGFPELIKQRLPAGHPAIRYCDAMLEVVPQMAEVSENMLALGRRGQLHLELIGLNGLVRQALVQVMELPATMTVNLDLDKHLLPVNGSRSQLLRVVSNLLSNAREAVSDNGVISLRTRNAYVSQPLGRYCEIEAGEYAVIEVCDTGPGIPTEIMDKIFDPFFTTKRPDRRCGSGLGLSIVQCIVNDHGGYVDVESAPDADTKFRVYLPVSGHPSKAGTGGQGRAELDGIAS